MWNNFVIYYLFTQFFFNKIGIQRSLLFIYIQNVNNDIA